MLSILPQQQDYQAYKKRCYFVRDRTESKMSHLYSLKISYSLVFANANDFLYTFSSIHVYFHATF